MKILLLSTSDKNTIDKVERSLKEYGLDDIIITQDKISAKKIIEGSQDFSMVICDRETIEWFPDKNYYKLLWGGENEEQLLAILGDTQ